MCTLGTMSAVGALRNVGTWNYYKKSDNTEQKAPNDFGNTRKKAQYPHSVH